MTNRFSLCALLVAIFAGSALAGDKKGPDPRAEIQDGLAKGNKATVIHGIQALGQEGGQKSAEAIIMVALNVDEHNKKFKAEDSNAVFDAAEEALAQIKDEKGEAFIFDQLQKNKDRRVRVFLCDVTAKRKSEAAESALIAAVKDKEPLVQKAAIQHLGLKKSKRAFEPVIEVLGKVEKKRDEPWLDCMRFLTGLTAKDFATAQDWKGWWDANKDKFDPATVSVGRREGAGAGETVSRDAPKLFGTDVLSKKVVFILDTSGSMAIKDVNEPGKRGHSIAPRDAGYGDAPEERIRMKRLKDAMIKLLEELPADTNFTLVTFASSTRCWNRELVPANAKNKQDAIDFARGMQAEGFTVTDEAFRQAFEIGGEPNTFYFFSDGIPQRSKGTYIEQKEILAEIEQSNRIRKVKIFTIGIGEADPNFMREIAAQNGGVFKAVE